MNKFRITISTLKDGEALPEMFMDIESDELQFFTRVIGQLRKFRKISMRPHQQAVIEEFRRRLNGVVGYNCFSLPYNKKNVVQCEDPYKYFASEIVGVNYGEIEKRIMATSPEAFKDTSEGRRRFHKLFGFEGGRNVK